MITGDFMKRFEFSLQQVLDLKTSQKHQIENEIAGLLAQKNQLEANLRELSDQWQAENDKLNLAKRKSLDAEFRLRRAYLDFIDQQSRIENKTLQNVLKQISTTREKLAVIIQEEKVIKKLREKRFDAYQAALRKEEQDASDDLVNQRVIQQIMDISELDNNAEK